MAIKLNLNLDFLKRAKKNEILAITAGVCAAVFVLYYFILLGPLISRLKKVMPQVLRLPQEIDQAKGDITRIGVLRARAAELESKMDYYRGRLATEAEFPALLESLSDRARSANVKIVKIIPKNEPEESAKDQRSAKERIYKESEILIYASAGYHQLGAFIYDMENGERFMTIGDVKIEGSKKTANRHDIQLVVKTYIINPEKTR